jgi:hypothetical protein
VVAEVAKEHGAVMLSVQRSVTVTSKLDGTSEKA